MYETLSNGIQHIKQMIKQVRHRTGDMKEVHPMNDNKDVGEYILNMEDLTI